jgi:ankyrin repeat protein
MKKLLNNDPRKYILEHENEKHLINQKDCNGMFPVYCASKNGNLEILKLLVESGALIN